MTEKKMRKQLRRIWFHFNQLQKALNESHNDGLICYAEWKDGPCHHMGNIREAIKTTTKDSIAEIIQASIRDSI